jgi:hypothetical protein
MKRRSSFRLVGVIGCLAAGLSGCDTNPLAPAREHPAALFSRGGSKSPSNTSARPENSSSVEITWTDNSSNEDGFHVERSTNGAASPRRFGAQASPRPRWSTSGLVWRAPSAVTAPGASS